MEKLKLPKESRDRILEVVLSYDKLAKRIHSEADRKHVIKIVDEMRASFSEKVVGGTASFLDLTFMKLYDSVNYQDPPGQNLASLAKENCIVLAPNHQSHVDYIALTYSVFKKHRLPIYVAGGINLNIFPIGDVFRKSGCFFIRRAFGRDILYKLTLEAYLYYLMLEGRPIEFFFEGGRSRTGKLLPPRFGFFSMILEIYQNHKDKIGRPLKFIPVSIVHEYVPETKAHAKELSGGQKTKESTTQLFNLYKLFSFNLGTINIRCGKPIDANESFSDLKSYTQQMAFNVYRDVGKEMLVSPTSLLSMVLLDEPSGALTWEQIYENCEGILNYCREFDVPLSEKLGQDIQIKSLKEALKLLMNNKKIELTKNKFLYKDYYSIRPESRIELMYFKNTILHHFIVPYIISACWVYIFNGTIKDFKQMKKFLLQQRKQLKYEFYLPTIKELITLGLNIISHCINREIASLEGAISLSTDEMFKVIKKTNVFARGFNYIFESYYISAATLRHLGGHSSFTKEQFLKDSKLVFEMEKSHGRFIKYTESYTHPILKNSLSYFENAKLVSREKGKYKVIDEKSVDKVMENYARHLLELMTINLKAHIK